ncbi:MAG: CAP domain-containing protein [Ktedonobacteraceae bacterium]
MKRLLLIIFTMSTLVTGTLYIHQRFVTTIHSGCVEIPATPDYLSSGRTVDAIAAINNAHQLEHLSPLNLPGNFYRLDPAMQQFILLNIERTDRHLHPLTLDANLSQMALGYSEQLRDLHFFSHTSPIGGSFGDRVNGNPAIANHYNVAAENLADNPVVGVGPIYEYMYDDSIEACGHRHSILNPAMTTVGINWVRGGPYGTISAQEFIASASWSPYVATSPVTGTPGLSININSTPGSTVMRFQTHIPNNTGTSIERITWFLDHSRTAAQVGSAWTLDTSMLAHGKHTIIAYVVDGEQSYSMAQETIVV